MYRLCRHWTKNRICFMISFTDFPFINEKQKLYFSWRIFSVSFLSFDFCSNALISVLFDRKKGTNSNNNSQLKTNVYMVPHILNILKSTIYCENATKKNQTEWLSFYMLTLRSIILYHTHGQRQNKCIGSSWMHSVYAMTSWVNSEQAKKPTRIQ